LLLNNQENLVLETLQSIYNQTYKAIELVVSDHASTDSTPEIIKTWVEQKGDRFVNVVLNFNKQNKGIF